MRASLDGGGGSSLRPTSASWAWSLSDIVAEKAALVRGAWERNRTGKERLVKGDGFVRGEREREGEEEEDVVLFIGRDDDEGSGDRPKMGNVFEPFPFTFFFILLLLSP